VTLTHGRFAWTHNQRRMLARFPVELYVSAHRWLVAGSPGAY
jgi:hypothetical protein